MTFPARITRVEAAEYAPGRWTMVGTLGDVASELESARRAGVLFSATAPAPLGDGRVLVNVRLIEQPRPALVGRAVPGWVWWACGGIAVAIAAGVTIAVLLAWHFRAVILGGLAVLALVWWLLGRAGACPGIHCPGCGCG